MSLEAKRVNVKLQGAGEGRPTSCPLERDLPEPLDRLRLEKHNKLIPSFALTLEAQDPGTWVSYVRQRSGVVT